MSLKFPQLRLIIPSLSQYNNGPNTWCARTSASMIFNYYYAARKGGIDASKEKLIINQRDAAPYDLVFRDDERHASFCRASGPAIAALRYRLQQTFEEIKPRGWVRKALWPKEARGKKVTEAKIYELLAPVIESLEMFNPVLFHSGLSGGTRHIVVISGYRVETDGSLWLHIDDPAPGLPRQRRGSPRSLGLASNFKKGGVNPTEVIKQEPTDTDVDGRPGVRYWLKAAILFTKNDKTTQSDRDYWCDHGFPYNPGDDSPGFTVTYNTKVPEPWSELVDADIEARYPVKIGEVTAKKDPVADLWDAVGKGGAPFPLGRNRTWHDGIHIPRSAAGSDDVLAFGPGELLFARFPEAKDAKEDFGMVIMRHAIDKTSLGFAAPSRSGELPEGAAWLYSLYANLKGGEAGAKSLLSRLTPGPEVEDRRFTTPATPAALLGEMIDGKEKKLRPLTMAATHLAGADFDAEELSEIEAFAAFDSNSKEKFRVLPVEKGLSNIEAWSTRPQPPKAPEGTKLGYEPLIEAAMIDTKETVVEAKAPTLAVDASGSEPDLVPMKKGNTGEGWYAVERYDDPGLLLGSHRWASHGTAQHAACKELAGKNLGVLVERRKSVTVVVKNAAGTDRTYTLKVGGRWNAPALLRCPFGREQPRVRAGRPGQRTGVPRPGPAGAGEVGQGRQGH